MTQILGLTPEQISHITEGPGIREIKRGRTEFKPAYDYTIPALATIVSNLSPDEYFIIPSNREFLPPRWNQKEEKFESQDSDSFKIWGKEVNIGYFSQADIEEGRILPLDECEKKLEEIIRKAPDFEALQLRKAAGSEVFPAWIDAMMRGFQWKGQKDTDHRIIPFADIAAGALYFSTLVTARYKPNFYVRTEYGRGNLERGQWEIELPSRRLENGDFKGMHSTIFNYLIFEGSGLPISRWPYMDWVRGGIDGKVESDSWQERNTSRYVNGEKALFSRDIASVCYIDELNGKRDSERRKVTGLVVPVVPLPTRATIDFYNKLNQVLVAREDRKHDKVVNRPLLVGEKSALMGLFIYNSIKYDGKDAEDLFVFRGHADYIHQLVEDHAPLIKNSLARFGEGGK